MKYLVLASIIFLPAYAGCATHKSYSQDCVIGSATMRPDRSIFMMLRADGKDGLVGDAAFEYKPGDPEYGKMLQHIGPIEPGQDKAVPCWPQE
jgi:hypothetical protein